MTRPKIHDFGAWVKQQLQAAGVTPAALARQSGFLYPSLARILNSGAGGRPVKPDDQTVERIGDALVALHVIDDIRQAWAAAGYVVEGFRIVRDDPPPRPPAAEPLQSIIREAGYDDQLFSDEDLALLRDNIEGLVERLARRRAQEPNP